MAHHRAARVPVARRRRPVEVTELPVPQERALHAVAERAHRLPAADVAAGDRN